MAPYAYAVPCGMRQYELGEDYLSRLPRTTVATKRPASGTKSKNAPSYYLLNNPLVYDPELISLQPMPSTEEDVRLTIGSFSLYPRIGSLEPGQLNELYYLGNSIIYYCVCRSTNKHRYQV